MDKQNIKHTITRAVLFVLPILALPFAIRFNTQNPAGLYILLFWFSYNSGYVFYDSRKRYPNLIWNIGLAIICGFPICFFVYIWLRPPVVFEEPEIQLRWKMLLGLNLWIIVLTLLIVILSPWNHFFKT